MRSTSIYGGDLLILPLSQMMKIGRGDDIVVTIDHETGSRYGTLGISNNRSDFNAARRLAIDEADEGPMMIAVEDPESGSPMMLTREIIRNGKKHHLAVIFNAEFSDAEESRPNSFCLRMSERLDPDGVFIRRIKCSPGQNITWEVEHLADLG
jgi:hypothetical protein